MNNKTKKSNKTTIKAMEEIDEMIKNKKKYKRYNNFKECQKEIEKNKLYIIKESQNGKKVKIEITEDDIGLILDGLYEQAMQQKENRAYSNALKTTAKKVEKVFN